VSEWDRDTSIIRRPWPTEDLGHEKKTVQQCSLWAKHIILKVKTHLLQGANTPLASVNPSPKVKFLNSCHCQNKEILSSFVWFF
jgi:hypothetical protein